MEEVLKNEEEVLEENKEYFKAFYEYLKESGLKEKTIDKHVENVSFYINEFVLYHKCLRMEGGAYFDSLDDFFGDFFIRKCMWSTPYTIKENIAGLNKFYKCMFEKKYISEDSYREYKDVVKDCKEMWIELCDYYNNAILNLDMDIFF